jgi:hypothetical protein
MQKEEKKLKRCIFLYQTALKIILIAIDRIVLFMLYIFHRLGIGLLDRVSDNGEQAWQ